MSLALVVEMKAWKGFHTKQDLYTARHRIECPHPSPLFATLLLPQVLESFLSLMFKVELSFSHLFFFTPIDSLQ